MQIKWIEGGIVRLISSDVNKGIFHMHVYVSCLCYRRKEKRMRLLAIDQTSYMRTRDSVIPYHNLTLLAYK